MINKYPAPVPPLKTRGRAASCARKDVILKKAFYLFNRTSGEPFDQLFNSIKCNYNVISSCQNEKRALSWLYQEGEAYATTRYF